MTLDRPIRETKLQSSCLQLTQIVKRLGPGAKLPTVRELSEILPASVATINNALHELEARSLIVRKHGVGIFVASHLPHHSIALICRPDFFRAIGSSPFWGLLLEQAQRYATAEQEELTFYFSESRQEAGTLTNTQQQEISSGHFHGIIGIGLDACDAEWIRTQSLPFVAFAGPGSYTVGFDNEELLRLGHEALLPFGARIIVLESEHNDLSKQQSGYLWGRTLLARPHSEWPEGIISRDDMLTLGLIGAFHEQGIPLDGPIRIATHANAGSPALLGWEEQLVRLEVSPTAIIMCLFEVLQALMRGEPPSVSSQKILICTVYGAKWKEKDSSKS